MLRILYVISSFCISASLASANEAFYCVKESDNLSAIAQKKLGHPIYGKDGSLEQLLRYNPGIKKENLIYKDQAIFYVDISNNNKCLLGAMPDQKVVEVVASPVITTSTNASSEPKRLIRLSVGNSLLISKFNSSLAEASVNLVSLFTPAIKAQICNSSDQCLYLGLQKVNYRVPSGYTVVENDYLASLHMSSPVYQFGNSEVELEAGIQESKHLRESSEEEFSFPSPLIGQIGLSYGYSYTANLGAFAKASLLTSGSGDGVNLSPGFFYSVGLTARVPSYTQSSVQLSYGMLKQESQLFALTSSSFNLNLQYDFN